MVEYQFTFFLQMKEESYLAIAWVAPHCHTWKKTNDQFFWPYGKICRKGKLRELLSVWTYI